jgi:mitogen-activated protein kinase 1/3
MSTPYVATRWYRSPELLFMWDTATKAMDVWSIGCIFAELLNRKVLFPGENYLNQIEKIVEIMGTPDPDDVRGCQKAKTYIKNFQSRNRADFGRIFPNASRAAIDLLLKMLHYNPEKRITVEEALKHPYLQSLHDGEDEPTCQAFDFEFESKVTPQTIKKVLYSEICEWNMTNNNLQGDAIVKNIQPKKIEQKIENFKK